jgi:hypothetical protein
VVLTIDAGMDPLNSGKRLVFIRLTAP